MDNNFRERMNAHTGPLTIYFSRNNDITEYFGALYGQDIEPVGFYVTASLNDDLSKGIRGFSNGQFTSQKPYFIFANDTKEWKERLYNKFKKKKRNLSIALKRDGFDSIIVFDNNDILEAVIL